MALLNEFVIEDGVDMGYAEAINLPNHAQKGNLVINGCGVTEQATPDLTVQVASGSVLVGGIVKSVSSGNIDLTTEYNALSTGQARFVYIYVDSAGAIQKLAGTAATAGQQYPPDFSGLPDDSVLLARVLLTEGDPVINTADIKDMRIYVPKGVQVPLPENSIKSVFVIGDGIYGIRIGNGTSAGLIPLISGRGKDANDHSIMFVAEVDPANDTGTSPLYVIDGRLSSASQIASRPLFAVRNYGNEKLNVNAEGVLTISGIHNSSFYGELRFGAYNIISSVYSSIHSILGFNAYADHNDVNQVLVYKTHSTAGYSYIRLGNGYIEFHGYNGSVTANNVASNLLAKLNGNGLLQLPASGSEGGILLGGDVNLYRESIDKLQTDDQFVAVGGLAIDKSGTTVNSQTRPSAQFLINIWTSYTGGSLHPGSEGDYDWRIYWAPRKADDSDYDWGQEFGYDRDVQAWYFDSTVWFGAGDNNFKLVMGTARDVNLYRGAANLLQTDDELQLTRLRLKSRTTSLNPTAATPDGSTNKVLAGPTTILSEGSQAFIIRVETVTDNGFESSSLSSVTVTVKVQISVDSGATWSTIVSDAAQNSATLDLTLSSPVEYRTKDAKSVQLRIAVDEDGSEVAAYDIGNISISYRMVIDSGA